MSAMFTGAVAYILLFAYVFIIRLGPIPVPIIIFVALAAMGYRLLLGRFDAVRLPLGVTAAMASIVALTLLSNLLNNTNDFFGISFVVSRLLYVLSAYVVVRLLFCAGVARTWDQLVRALIVLYVVQALIALTIFALPEIGAKILAIQFLDDLSNEVLDATIGLRFIGLGAANFGGGISFGVAMILFAAYIVKHGLLSGARSYLVALVFLLLFLVGFFIARTAVIGAGLALMLILWYGRMRGAGYVLKVVSVVIVLLLVAGSLVSDDFLERMGFVFDWAFEMFLNYASEGEFASSSTEQLKSMYVLPDDVWTYVFGDGLFMAPGGGGYYKDIDVGYLRLLYYLGIPGMLAILAVSAILFWRARSQTADPHYRAALLLVLAYFLICNFKGFADFVVFSALFYVFSRMVASQARAPLAPSTFRELPA